VKIEKELTIEQVAELLSCSKDTVRRKIKKGEITAIKRTGAYGDQFFIPEESLNLAMEIHEVIPVERNLSVQDFTSALDNVLREYMLPVQQELTTLGNQNEALKREIATLHDSLNAIEERQREREATHFDLVDQRLKDISMESKKGFWARLFRNS
jgi:excisionase family DNA binding protein